MFKRWLFFLMVIMPMGLLAQKVLINDPHVQPREIGAFHSIRVSNAIDLFLSQDESEALAVSALRPEFRDKIITEVENGVLKIYVKDRISFSGNMRMRAYVSCKELKLLKASGASDVIVTGSVRAKELMIDMSGASDFKGQVEAGNLVLKLSGASDAKMSGTAATVVIDASGASDLLGYDLITDFCTIESSGASDVKITVNKELNARASGSSDVSYKGAAVVKNVQSSGSGSVKKKD